MDLIAKWEQAGKDQNINSPMTLYRFPAEGVAQIWIKGLLSHLK